MALMGCTSFLVGRDDNGFLPGVGLRLAGSQLDFSKLDANPDAGLSAFFGERAGSADCGIAVARTWDAVASS